MTERRERILTDIDESSSLNNNNNESNNITNDGINGDINGANTTTNNDIKKLSHQTSFVTTKANETISTETITKNDMNTAPNNLELKHKNPSQYSHSVHETIRGHINDVPSNGPIHTTLSMTNNDTMDDDMDVSTTENIGNAIEAFSDKETVHDQRIIYEFQNGKRIKTEHKKQTFLQNILDDIVSSKTERKPKLNHATFRLIYMIIIFTFFRKLNGFIIITLFLGLLNQYFWIRFCYALYISEQIYRIKLYTKQLPNTASIVYPYKIVHYPKIPVSSVSEFIGMRGSTFHDLLLVAAERLVAFQLSAAAFKWNNMTNRNDVSIILFLAGCVCEFLVVQFVIHPEDVVFVLLHYVGALGVGLLGVAFCIQQKWSLLSCLILFIGGISFVIWQIFKIFADQIPFLADKHDDVKIVKRTSILIMLPEIIAVYLFSMCGVLFVGCMGNGYIIGPKLF